METEATVPGGDAHDSWRQSVYPSRVVLRVSNPELSAGYYSALTAMEVRESDLDRAVLGAPDGGPVLLELRRAEQPGPAPRRASGLFHTAFLYPGRRGLGAALKRMGGGSFNVTGASDHLVSEAIYLDDPDGLGIELYRDRPRSEWRTGHGTDRVAMDTIPLDVEPIYAAAPDGTEPAGEGLVVGHVHLKVADLAATNDFWTDLAGLDLMVEFGGSALFFSTGGYHHHIGANTWFSAGQPCEPQSGPGLEEVVLEVTGGDATLDTITTRLQNANHPFTREAASLLTATPDGIPLRFELAPVRA